MFSLTSLTQKHLRVDQSHFFLVSRLYLSISWHCRTSSLAEWLEEPSRRVFSSARGSYIHNLRTSGELRKETTAVISPGLMTAKTSARLGVTKSHELLFPKRRGTSRSFRESLFHQRRDIYVYRTSVRQIWDLPLKILESRRSCGTTHSWGIFLRFQNPWYIISRYSSNSILILKGWLFT